MAERIKGLQIDLSMQDMGISSTLAGIKRSFKQLNSDLKLSSNNFKYSEKSMTSYKNRIRELDAATKQQRNNVKELRKQYEQMVKDKGANNAAAVRLRTEYNKQADTLNRLEHELEQTVDGFKRFQKEAQEAARVSNSSFGRLGQKFTDIGPKLTSVGESMKSVGRSMSMYVTAPVVAGFGLAAKKSIDFDDSMRKVKATSGATGKEFNLLRDKALEMGAKTKFSASQSADALNYMALAGWDTKDMLNGIDGVMQLAAASGEDLGAVSDIVTDSLTAFGMKAKDSGHFADVLAQTSSKANTDVRGLGEAFKYAAPVAGALGYTVEDTSIAIGLMSNAGIKGEKAGTALRTMFTNLTKPTGEMKKKLDELGISITDSSGNMLPMRDVMDQLRGKFKGLSKDQQASAAATIFGKEAMSGALAIINASDEDYKKLTKSIDNSTGASKRMSDEMEGGIGGSIRKMKSAIESMAISIGDVLAPHIRRAADFLAMLADKFTSMPGWVKTGVVGLGVFAAALGPLILTTGMFTASLGSIMTTLGPLMTGIVKAGGVMNFLGTKAPFAAKGLTLVGGAFKFMLGPIGLAIAAVVAIGTAFVIAYKKSETFRNIVHTVIDPVVNAFKNLWNTAKEVFNSLKSLLSGNTLPTVDLLSKIMPKATANRVTVNLMKVRQTFINVFNAIWNFGREIGGKIASFWKQNGDDVIQAFVNIGNFFKGFFIELRNLIGPNLRELGTLVKTIFTNIIVPTIQIAMKVIWEVMKFLWPLIKTLIVDTWNNIKNIIKGALDVILGIVKIFSGIFTGQWGQVWNGVKQIFSGALTLIWNLVQLWFIGKILKVVKLFGGFFKSAISTAFNGVKSVIATVLKFIWSIISSIFKRILSITKSIFNGIWTFIKFVWNGIKNAISNAVKFIFNAVKRYFTAVKNTTSTIFNAVKSYISKLWTGIKNIVSSIVRSLWSSVKNTWNTLYSGTRGVFNKVKSWITNLWNSIKRTVSKIASNLWSSIKRTWNYLWSGTRNIFNRVKNSIVNVWNSIKRSVTGIVSSLWNGVRRIFTNMSNGLRGIIGRIKGHIGGMISKIKSGLNSLIRGLNWVGSKLSLPKIPTLSTGTVHNQQINRSVKTTSDGRMKQDTMAIVGDKGPGNGKGRDGRRELIQYPNGRTALTPAKDTPTIIPKGGRVISGGIRQQMANSGTLPKLNGGTWFSKAGSWIGSKMRSAGDWLKDRLGDVLDFVGKPSKLLNKLLSSLGIDFGSLTKGMGIVGQITRGAWNKIKNGAIKWLKGGLDSAGGDIKGGILDPRLINYHFGHTAAYTAATGRPFHEGVDFPFVYKTIRTPMGGKVARQSFMHGGYGNWVKVISGAMEMIFAHLRDFSKTPPTGKTVKAGDVIGLTGNTGFSTGPHLHFGIRKNGRDVDPEPYLWRAQRQGRLKVSGKGGGGLGRITETVKTALSQTGLPTTKRFVDFWSKKINEKDGTGLLDISKSTFNAFKAKGHDKYNNTLDNLMAGMRYAKVNYGSSLLDKAKRFASGGLIKNSGWYNLAEGGYPEYVISTDPALYSDSMKLLALAAQDIDRGKKIGNKRPGQLPRIGNSSDNAALLMQMIENQQQQINVLMEIARSNQVVSEKDFELIVDDDSFERRHNRYQDKRERRERKSNMYRGGAFAT
ncbi:phage tail tape measure protein [Staphylococcus pseudintermedius]|uniref:phage tail tape measure protein n=1 Tax=Staphylococcus pseudintermedius TaxID=283734 RepID=UPI0015F1D543|nr:phage tail tape measure protein [Staphylococcus pseudintermedius]QDX56976.1 phage tail tape measure protein [Staphylococcus pseudintermedius]